ncbi:MAG: RIP metalloprotease RseP [Sulfobacillus thermosulfidooxidans]|uniref:Zinc metalloprotease n=1 Tax=Sulfobacillus thermosulfidooxidans TaxID=28034 RepID=A0A2T2WZK0_SULTH|nr:MAG: RIP metalloprotease RseP [Sulfobacillus thermosulfidooxidans]
MTTVIAIILVFGVLVAVHELGHFLVAKAFGMRVNEYSLGFGPSLYKHKWGETQYALRIIPLGGYVRLAGMEGDKTGDPREFPNRPLWQRFLVVLAGPFMNLILAAVLYAVSFGPVGIPTATTTVQQALPHYPAYEAGIRPGDKIVNIGGTPVTNWEELASAIVAHHNHVMDVTVVRHGRRQTFAMKTRYDKTLHQYVIGIKPQVITIHLNPFKALVAGVTQTIQLTGAWFFALFRLLGGHGPFDLTGPVGIAELVSQAAQSGLVQLLLLSAALSANLGLFNILPIPVLDGSRLFLMVVEGIRHKAMDPDRENMIHFVGFVLLMALVLVVTFHDIEHLFHA